MSRARPLSDRESKFVDIYVVTNDARKAAKLAGYRRAGWGGQKDGIRKTAWELLRRPRIIVEIERRRRVPNLKDFLESGQQVDENFLRATANELLDGVRKGTISISEAAAMTRLLEFLERDQRDQKAKAAEEKKPNPYAKLTAEEVAQRLADNMAKLEAAVAAETDQAVREQLEAGLADLKRKPDPVPVAEDAKDPHAPWRQASPPAWRPSRPASEPNLGHGTMCLNNADHGTYTGAVCPQCELFWQAEAARERRSWAKALIPSWG